MASPSDAVETQHGWVGRLQLGSEELWVLGYDIEPTGLESLLTVAEREVVRGVLEGLGDRAIARRRGCSPATVSSHLQAIYKKLGVQSRTELVVRLFRGTPGNEPT